MSGTNPPVVGSITWADLTIENAQEVRDFYREVVGWQVAELDMGGYSDYCVNEPATGKTVAGICHARGMNTGLPAQWLIYITVADIETSVARCREKGGQVLVGPKSLGAHGTFCVIQDPAGAVAALIEPTK